MENISKKCYNSLSCILSVVIIVFIIGAMLFDIFISKPKTRENIAEIKFEIKKINEKIELYNTVMFNDSIVKFN